jgi:hypothetical protein
MWIRRKVTFLFVLALVTRRGHIAGANFVSESG